jgi:TetR/AcrR family transcriptional regulator, cholesterol catabolism regulator
VLTQTTRKPSSKAMTPRQRERRAALVDAVIDLVAERGVEDLQMREVAERSGVSLGTLYRYFASKDHLVAEAFMTWAARLDDRVDQRGVIDPQAPMAERLSNVLRLGVRPFQRQPRFARMLIYVSASPDPLASEHYLELGRIIRSVLGRALPELEPTRREAALQVLGSVWYHGLVEWVSGRIGVGELLERLDRACWLLAGEWEARP